MQRSWVLFSILFLYSFSATAQPVKDKLDRLLDNYARNKNFNGTVLVAKKGTVLLEKGYGYRDMNAKTLNDENTIYRIGQVTEALTSEIILQLDSKAQLGLDDYIVKYIPGFPNAEKISIRNLLTHTSGVSSYVPDLTIQRNKVCRPINLETFLETYNRKQLLFQPGARYAYSNADYILLGFIIEKISKVHYEDEMGYKLFTICSMQHSGFDFAELKNDNKATGYNYESNRFSEARETGDTAVLYPANAMYSTVGDLYRWHEALRWYKLLPKDWQELAYVPVRNDFALGWTISHMYNKRFMEHDGKYAGFTSCVVRQEDDDVFIAVLENKMQQGYSNADVAKDILKILYGPDTKNKDNKEAEHDQGNGENPLKRFTGKYLFNTDYTLTIKLKDEELTVESPDEQPITLVPESETVFKTKNANVTIDFVPDEKGNVNKAILRQNGKDYTGKRVK